MQTNNNELPQEKKLTVIFRIEPGCLGPTGSDLIDDFCGLAEKEFESIDSDFMTWQIVPRRDKAQPEMTYQVNNKKLDHDKAEKYLSYFDKNLDEVEEHLHEHLATLIDDHLGY